VRTPSRLERKFALLWRTLGGPVLEKEFRFHPKRRWRADFAHLESRTLIEIEGGAWVSGRHNRGTGFIADTEKYLEAVLRGWRVVRLAAPQITPDNLRRIIAAILNQWPTPR